MKNYRFNLSRLSELLSLNPAEAVYLSDAVAVLADKMGDVSPVEFLEEAINIANAQPDWLIVSAGLRCSIATLRQADAIAYCSESH